MADLPEEVREAAMSDHERFIVAVAYDCGYQAGLAAGKRAGMERAAEIAVGLSNSAIFGEVDREATCARIALAIRSENDG